MAVLIVTSRLRRIQRKPLQIMEIETFDGRVDIIEIEWIEMTVERELAKERRKRTRMK